MSGGRRDHIVRDERITIIEFILLYYSTDSDFPFLAAERRGSHQPKIQNQEPKQEEGEKKIRNSN
jgi:hypothetical protein